MRKVVLVALCFSAVTAGFSGGAQVSAADLGDWRSDRSYKDEPVYVPRYPFSWTGFYVGANVGYGFGDSSSFADTGEGFAIHPGGWVGGLQGGYNWQYDRFMTGVEIDLGVLGADDGQSSATAFTDTEYGGYGALTGRLGMVEDRWLFYLKGGLAFASIENRAGIVAGGVITDLTEKDEMRLGWTVGGGVEYAFQPNWSMKVEYMYMDFGDDTSRGLTGDIFHHDNELHAVKVGVNYRLMPGRVPLR